MHSVRHKDIVFRGQQNQSVPLRILSFNLETRVRSDMVFMPYHTTAEMPVIQIGNIMQMGFGCTACTYRIIFTLQGCTEIPGAEVRSFPTEASMLLAWREFIMMSDPDLITGHNIACFNFVYLLFRAEVLRLSSFACLGRLKG
ncbi:ribonuclease H-like domain-containing protein [Mycena rosella]|uniref:DNA polymerase delta catalytic subunit n=1 Tax=Mycena rosella TaxID=1033263 RepID=A0AAD7GMD3_MYCRO|nr:ribonuclease H-like domain-containing protein [Mycena rosella]